MSFQFHGRLVIADHKAFHFPEATLIFMLGNDLFVIIFFVASIFLKLAGEW